MPMPSLFTLFCSCLNLSKMRPHIPFTSTKIQKVTPSSSKQTNDFLEEENNLGNAESTIHLTFLNAPAASPKQKIIDFFEIKNRPSFAEICPSAIYNKEMPTTN